MQRARNHIAHKEIHQTLLPRAATANNASIPEEETAQSENLEPPSPTATAGLDGLSAGNPEMAI